MGNHEFDERAVEPMRMQNGGCHPVDGCRRQHVRRSGFHFLGADALDEATGKPSFRPMGSRRTTA